ncbi:ketoacyl-ACP synthase III [Gluconacetobacter azotocaptans]|uniref:ketoacyl-ACP synthase III n=1 Tax=Gluconacetobacter azotocaptans TaxID=142834 RepID=UPI00195B3B27|nr:ketoacyl-ACP synthase III [Gluconacetobacter azotocaptans]MBM9403563.1 ketoacyl-ACP synthase III [Gluconacetobacter azotocaptans]
MSILSVPGVTLRGVVCAVPERRVENDEFIGRFSAKSVADVTALTGVMTRYVAAPEQTAGDLCFASAERLLEQLEWHRDSVDALIFVSQTPDQRMPATSCILHGRLGLARRCQAFDVGLGCSGYVYGTWLAAALIAAGCRRVLLLAGDTSSRLVNPDDRGTALLFGDASSATALEYAADAPPAHFNLGTDGSGAEYLTVPGGGFRPVPDDVVSGNALRMDGSAVFGFTISTVPALIREILTQAGRTADDIDIFALHQANQFILQHITKKLKIPVGRLPVNIDRYGNTSSASVPLLLCTDLADRLTETPAELLMAGFGVGLSWGAALFSGVHLKCASVINV